MIYVNKFLENSKADLSIDSVLKYLSTIKINSVRPVYWAIRFFYKANDIPFPLKVDEVTQKTHINIIKESLTMEEIKAFIETSKKYYGIMDIGYSAISTIYAARRAEMYNIEFADINEDITKLRIKTLKGGEDRVHSIPDELKEILENFKDGLKKIKNKPVIQSLNFLYDHICAKAGIKLRPRLGWHSNRRALISEFRIIGFNDNVLRSFCRWKPRERDIIMNYDIQDPKRIDSLIFEKHPFLEYWR
jgi:integrase